MGEAWQGVVLNTTKRSRQSETLKSHAGRVFKPHYITITTIFFIYVKPKSIILVKLLI